MTPIRARWAITLALAAMPALAAPAAPSAPTGALQPALSPEDRTLKTEHRTPGSIRYFQDADGPIARRPDGREYRLLPLSPARRREALNALAAAGRGERAPTARAESAPEVVDHRRFYGPIRDQAGRGTCVSFAAAAALEGAYRRADAAAFANLDLSEQWINHVQKMVDRRATRDADQMETAMGSWGGSYVHYLMRVIARYGVAEEALLRYNPSGEYEAIGQEFRDENAAPLPTAKQIVADNFNLDPYRLPLTVLEKAPYRPTALRLLPEEMMRDPAALEQIVAEGHDIAFSMTLVEDERTADGAWIPKRGGLPIGGHAMLIVGYNRPRQYFLVRNSWGPDGDADDGGYARISYDYFHRYCWEGAIITAVADPRPPASRERLWLRRWDLGQQGKLDLYRLPDTYSWADEREQDYRVGTFFDAQGRAYRVNGALAGEDLVITIDLKKPNQAPDELSGTRFHLKLNAAGTSWTVVP